MRSADTIGAAMRWVARGQSYAALCQEIAWTAVRSTGLRGDDVEWLVSLVDRQFAEQVDRLPQVVREARLRAEAEHLRARPHDHAGAEVVAELAAHDAAVEQLSIAYMDALDWAVGVVRERQANERERVGRMRRLVRRHVELESPVPCEVPRRILEGLHKTTEKPGWPKRSAA